MLCHRLDGIAAAGLLADARSSPASQTRYSAQQGMLNLDCIQTSPAPRAQVFRSLRLVDGIVDCSRQKLLIVRILRRQPSLGPMQHHILQPHRSHLPGVSLPAQCFFVILWIRGRSSQPRLQEQARERRASAVGNRRRGRGSEHAPVPVAHDVGRLFCARRWLRRMVHGIYETLG